MLKNKFAIILFFVFVFAPPAYSIEEPLIIQSIRPLGLGGAFLALSDDQYALLYNPAGITQRTSALIALQTNASIPHDLAGYALDAYTGDPTSLTVESLFDYFTNNFINKTSLFYAAPLNLTLIAPPMGYFNVGLGIYTGVTRSKTFIDSNIIPTMTLDINMDSAVIVPLAYDMGETMTVGLSLKGINRNKLSESKSLLELVTETGEVSLGPLNDALAGLGFGVDAGLLYHLNTQFTFGATFQDIYTKIYYSNYIHPGYPYTTTDITPAIVEIIPFRINLGISYAFNNEELPMGDNMLLVFQYDDLMGSLEEYNPGLAFRWKNIHAGLELAWDFAALRIGLNQGYPTIGVGIHLSIFSIDYAYYGEEYGILPGSKPVYNSLLSLTLGN